MTNILLITSLISILSDSFSRVIARARLVDILHAYCIAYWYGREEYLFVYSVYVLEVRVSHYQHILQAH